MNKNLKLQVTEYVYYLMRNGEIQRTITGLHYFQYFVYIFERKLSQDILISDVYAFKIHMCME